MFTKTAYRPWLVALATLLLSGAALAAPAKPSKAAMEEKAMREKMEMLERMEMMEKMELAEQLDEAQACAARNNFNCAHNKLQKAQGLATDRADQGKIASTQSAVANQQSRYEDEQRRYAEEQRRLAAEQQRQQSLASHLAAASDCLTAQKLDCTKASADKARALAANEAERSQIAAIENKAMQVAQTMASARSSGSGYASNSSSAYKPSSYSPPSSSNSSNIYSSPPTKDNSASIRAMNNTFDKVISNIQRQESNNRSIMDSRRK